MGRRRKVPFDLAVDQPRPWRQPKVDQISEVLERPEGVPVIYGPEAKVELPKPEGVLVIYGPVRNYHVEFEPVKWDPYF